MQCLPLKVAYASARIAKTQDYYGLCYQQTLVPKNSLMTKNNTIEDKYLDIND
jgi:hypothetical protein